MRCTRCMGKKITLAVVASPDFTRCVKSSSDCKSTPRRLAPAGVRASRMPQNFSRGFCSVTRTRCPGFMAILHPSAYADNQRNALERTREPKIITMQAEALRNLHLGLLRQGNECTARPFWPLQTHLDGQLLTTCIDAF